MNTKLRDEGTHKVLGGEMLSPDRQLWIRDGFKLLWIVSRTARRSGQVEGVMNYQVMTYSRTWEDLKGL